MMVRAGYDYNQTKRRPVSYSFKKNRPGIFGAIYIVSVILFLKCSHIINNTPSFICIRYFLLKTGHIISSFGCFIKERTICLALGISFGKITGFSFQLRCLCPVAHAFCSMA